MDPYSVLRVGRDSTDAEIRRAYRKMLLENHPDTCKGPAEYTIDQINEAYKNILDMSSSTSSGIRVLDVRFSDVKDLSEFNFDEEKDQFSRPCRCGQEMVLTVQELEKNGDADEIAIQCTGCSLWILVQYEVENA